MRRAVEVVSLRRVRTGPLPTGSATLGLRITVLLLCVLVFAVTTPSALPAPSSEQAINQNDAKMFGIHVVQSPGRFQRLGTIPLPLAACIIVLALIFAASAAFTVVVAVVITVIVAVAVIVVLAAAVSTPVAVTTLTLVFFFC